MHAPASIRCPVAPAQARASATPVVSVVPGSPRHTFANPTYGSGSNYDREDAASTSSGGSGAKLNRASPL